MKICAMCIFQPCISLSALFSAIAHFYGIFIVFFPLFSIDITNIHCAFLKCNGRLSRAISYTMYDGAISVSNSNMKHSVSHR